MAITLGAEVALSLHLDQQRSYADLEAALVDAGFEDYTIMRSVNNDDSSDVQLYVRHRRDDNGQVDPLIAGATLTALADAILSLESSSTTTS